MILGTVAVRDPDLVKQACRLFPGKIAVGIDARGGKVAVEGWAEASTARRRSSWRKKFEGAGVAAIIYTDIDRDGVLAGINWEATIALADAVSIPVIASGGLASIADIVRMTMPDAQKLEGAISGRALYDGRIDPAEALAILHAAPEMKVATMKLTIVLAPYDSGHYRSGFGLGPEALIAGGTCRSSRRATATTCSSRISARSATRRRARSRPALRSAGRSRARFVGSATTGASRSCLPAIA